MLTEGKTNGSRTVYIAEFHVGVGVVLTCIHRFHTTCQEAYLVVIPDIEH